MINLTSFDLAASINQQLFSYPSLYLKREDKISVEISGNKYRKLILNLMYAKKNGFNTLLTFGGAYSNHIVAVSSAARSFGFQAIGVIRGEELALKKIDEMNPTLQQAALANMHLYFVSRKEYQQRYDKAYQQSLMDRFNAKDKKIYVIPEGGTNTLAIEGCLDILTPEDEDFDIIACPVGTGGTITGLIHSVKNHQSVLGFPALEGDFLQQDIENLLKQSNHLSKAHHSQTQLMIKKQWQLISGYTFGGYGKTKDTLIEFINQFYQLEGIKLDPIYTGKMVYGVCDMLQKGIINSNSKVLMIHTGGIQGVDGFNQKQQSLNKPSLIFSS